MRWLVVAVLVALLPGVALADGAWLDRPPTQWNAPGRAVPAAKLVGNLARCTDRERAPSGAEEATMAAAGWKLEDYWAAQRAGDLALVMATAGYDGMCRPISFQGFVFAGGRFAGTIAPAPMDSRTDGVLAGTPTLSPDTLEARYVRYAPTDPLCCPSRGHTVVRYRVERGAAGPVLLAERIAAEAPTQLPRTGGFPAPLPVGVLLVGLGALLRRRR